MKFSQKQIFEIFNNNSPKKYEINWKRDGNSVSFIGTALGTCEGMKTLQVNNRKNALKLVAEDIKKSLREIGLDCDYIAHLIPQGQFYIRLTLKIGPKPTPKKEAALEKETTVKEKKVGVLETILELIKSRPQTQQSILDKLVFMFPERDALAMKKTIQAQLGGKSQPTRMEKERKVEFLIKQESGITFYSFVK